jgi:hypothetical protein
MQGLDRTTNGQSPTLHPPTDGSALARLGSALLRALSAARNRFGAAGIAHARRCRLDQVSPEILRDIGISREDATGVKSQQPELPFFMQSGFGGRRG